MQLSCFNITFIENKTKYLFHVICVKKCYNIKKMFKIFGGLIFIENHETYLWTKKCI